MTMAFFILQALYFFLPAYMSNMAPVILGKINIFPQNVNRKLFGKHKSWGGLLYGILLGTLTFYIQRFIPAGNLTLIDYDRSLLLGFLLASGAILGDLVKSLFKRRLNKKAGSQWFPFDQLDYVIGALLFTSIIYIPPLRVILTVLILAPGLHYGANYIGYRLGLKKVKW
jgi:CDP-2,3-bis-(O-geranylgeranyl)-sn-glycerol synthase